MELRELQNIYNDRETKECLAFDYVLRNEEQKELLLIRFVKEPTYKREMWVASTLCNDELICKVCFEVPKLNARITFVCETGLNYIMAELQERMQAYNSLYFAISELLKK